MQICVTWGISRPSAVSQIENHIWHSEENRHNLNIYLYKYTYICVCIAIVIITVTAIEEIIATFLSWGTIQ